jgi:cytochrome c2
LKTIDKFNIDLLRVFVTIIVLMTGLILSVLVIQLRLDQTKKQEAIAEQFYCGTSYYEKSYMPEDVVLNSQGKELFEANCSACHSIYKIKVGPALKGLKKRRDAKWIARFIRNSQRVIKKEKDPYAVALYNKYNETEMTAFPSLTDKEIKALIEYVSQ